MELDAAVTAFDGTKDRITGDVIYSGDINKWKKFANSLRLRYAMRISDVNPQKAQEEFEKLWRQMEVSLPPVLMTH